MYYFMKRKKSRHKAVATEFLSGISLDGCYPKATLSRVHLNGCFENSTIVADLADRFQRTRTPSNDASKVPNSSSSIVESSEFSTEKSHSTERDCQQYPVSVDLVTLPHFVRTQQDAWTTDSNSKYVGDSCLRIDSNMCRTSFASQSSPANYCTQLASSVETGDATFHTTSISVDKSVFLSETEWSEKSTRIALCPVGLPNTRLVVFSVIPFDRKTWHPNVRSTARAQKLTSANSKGPMDHQTLTVPCSSVAGHLSSQHNQEQQQQQHQNQQLQQLQQSQTQSQQPGHRLSQLQPHAQQSTSNSVVPNEPLLTAFSIDPSRSLSSMRPIGDEVVSFAQFLKPQVNLWLSSPNACTLLKPGCLTFGFRDPEFVGPNPNDSCTSAFGPSVNRSQARHSSTTNPSAVSHWSRSTHMFPRARNSSGGSGCPMSSVISGNSPTGIVYPDPLIYYIPTLLDDPDLLVATGKRVLKLPNYLTSVITYVRPSEQKRNVNREFHERFPLIQLTLTKLRSIKSVLVRITQRLSLDLWIAAHAVVLFEKLILRLLVNKLNRRLCASAVLLISAKLNDVRRTELPTLVQELENNFKISRRDLIQTELDVALSLEFCLSPSDQEIMVHYMRIYKSLDLAPSYALSCLGRLPHSASLPSVTVHEQTT